MTEKTLLTSSCRTDVNLWFWADLDFAALARGFALLRLPKMPELRGRSFPDFQETAVDTDAIPFKDKNREKQRRKMLAEQKERGEEAPPRRNLRNKAWSKQKSKKERRKRRAAKRKHEEVSAAELLPLETRVHLLLSAGL